MTCLINRQIPAAAQLIQCLWRCHAAEKTSSCTATWTIHLRVNWDLDQQNTNTFTSRQRVSPAPATSRPWSRRPASWGGGCQKGPKYLLRLWGTRGIIALSTLMKRYYHLYNLQDLIHSLRGSCGISLYSLVAMKLSQNIFFTLF